MISLGYALDEEAMNKLFERFKLLADKKKNVTDADLEALVSDEIYQPAIVYTLDGLQVACGTMGLPTATVRLIGPNGEKYVKAAIGTGPVDAAFKAIDCIIQTNSILREFIIHAITEGIDAQGEVSVRIEKSDLPIKLNAQTESVPLRSFGGYGADTDIIVASAKAYLSAINKMLTANESSFSPTANQEQVFSQPIQSQKDLTGIAK